MKHIKSFQIFEAKVILDPILQKYRNLAKLSNLFQNFTITPAGSYCHAFNFETKRVLTDEDGIGPSNPNGGSFHTGEHLQFNCATEDGQVFIACINTGDEGEEVRSIRDFIDYIGLSFDEKLELWKIAYDMDKSCIKDAPEDIAIILTNPKVRPMLDYGII